MDKVAGKPAATDESQELWEFSESESWSNHEKEVAGKLVAHEKVTWKLVASRNLEDSGNPKAGNRKWPHNSRMSSAVVPRMEKVFSIVRKIYDRSFHGQLGGPRRDHRPPYGVYSWTPHFPHCKQQSILVKLVCRIYDLPRINSWSLWNSCSEWQKNWSRIRKKTVMWPRLIFKELTWSATSLLRDKAFEITNAKTYVFADSVLCLGSMRGEPIEAWKNNIKWCLENRYLKDLNRIDGESMEFKWKIFPGFTTLDIFEEIPKFMKDLPCEPEQFKDRIIFMSMYNDIAWSEQGNTEKCENNSVTVANYARRFPRGRWSFLGPGSEKKWYGTYSDKPDGDWDKTAERMMLNFSCSRSSEISCRQRPGKRRIKKQRKRKKVYSLQR